MNDHEQRQVFDDWFPRLKPMVTKIVRVFAFTAADRDDLFQEIAMQVWRSIPSFRNQSMVTTWLYRIGLNTSIKWSQKEKKHRHNRDPVEQVESVLHDEPGPTDERLEWIYEEIAGMDFIDRSITLLLLDGLSYKEMASVVGISESNIGVKINRIKKRLTEKSKKN